MESATIYYKLLGILNFDSIIKFKIVTFAKKLSNDPTKYPHVFHEYLKPITSVHNHNTRLAVSDSFYRPNVKTNYGQFTIKFTVNNWFFIIFCYDFLLYCIFVRYFDMQ